MSLIPGVAMAREVLLWGAVAGVIHFVFLGIAYGNPLIDRLYVAAAATDPAVRKWPSKPRYLITQFLGTQVEVYLLTIGFVWLRPLLDVEGLAGTLLLGAVLAGLRVYPRFWNMWIQSTYPHRLLAVEVINGLLGSLLVVLTLDVLVPM